MHKQEFLWRMSMHSTHYFRTIIVCWNQYNWSLFQQLFDVHRNLLFLLQFLSCAPSSYYLRILSGTYYAGNCVKCTRPVYRILITAYISSITRLRDKTFANQAHSFPSKLKSVAFRFRLICHANRRWWWFSPRAMLQLQFTYIRNANES